MFPVTTDASFLTNQISTLFYEENLKLSKVQSFFDKNKANFNMLHFSNFINRFANKLVEITYEKEEDLSAFVQLFCTQLHSIFNSSYKI